MLIWGMELILRSDHFPFWLDLINGPQCATPIILVSQKNFVLIIFFCFCLFVYLFIYVLLLASPNIMIFLIQCWRQCSSSHSHCIINCFTNRFVCVNCMTGGDVDGIEGFFKATPFFLWIGFVVNLSYFASIFFFKAKKKKQDAYLKVKDVKYVEQN